MYENLSNEQLVRELEHYADIEKQFIGLRGAINEAARRLKSFSLPDTSGATPDSPPTQPDGVSPAPSGTFHFEIASINKHVVRAAVLQLVEAIEEFGLYTGPVCSELGIDGKAYITD